MTTLALIDEAARIGLRILPVGHWLYVRGECARLTPELREKLLARKPALMQILRRERVAAALCVLEDDDFSAMIRAHAGLPPPRKGGDA